MAHRYKMVEDMKTNPIIGKVKMISHVQGWFFAILALCFLYPW